MVAVLATLLALSSQHLDTTTYRDRATAALVARAQVRHFYQDTLVHDYTAMVRTRVDAGFGKRRFAVVPPIFAMETAAELTWTRPNDMKVNVVGARAVSSIRGVRAGGTFDDPWFIPRGLGDSIRFLDDELPETGALHPLSGEGPDHYRYAIVDSLTMRTPERDVRAVGLRVEPKHLAPSLVAGNIWLDAETAEVVRMTIVFVGEYLWERPNEETAEDSARARNDNKWANRIVKVEAELEYGLHESKYWMPYRQLITLTAEIPWFINVRVPVRFLSTFSGYAINRGATIQFSESRSDSTVGWSRCRDQDSSVTYCREQMRARRDRLRAGRAYTRQTDYGKSDDGGRWEINVPPRDSLALYRWPDDMTLAPDPAAEELIRETAATLAKINSQLPAQWAGRQALAPAWDRFSDLFRFNRVQGASLGGGVQAQPSAFVTVLAAARFGFSDRRLTGSLKLRHDAPAGRFEMSVWRDVREAEPWTSGPDFGNSLNALLAGHDDADYHLALGGGVAYTANHGFLRDVELTAAFEQHRSMTRRSGSSLNDWLGGPGVFPANPAVQHGEFFRVSASRQWLVGRSTLSLGADGLLGSTVSAGRGWTSARAPFVVLGRSHALSLRAAGMVGDNLPQMRLRLGGPHTVRGYDYGTRTGTGVWAARLDLGLSRRSAVSPVIFADVGNVTDAGAGDPLVGVGGGLSILNGLIRFNLSKGVKPETPLRFDLLFRAPR